MNPGPRRSVVDLRLITAPCRGPRYISSSVTSSAQFVDEVLNPDFIRARVMPIVRTKRTLRTEGRPAAGVRAIPRHVVLGIGEHRKLDAQASETKSETVAR